MTWAPSIGTLLKFNSFSQYLPVVATAMVAAFLELSVFSWEQRQCSTFRILLNRLYAAIWRNKNKRVNLSREKKHLNPVPLTSSQGVLSRYCYYLKRCECLTLEIAEHHFWFVLINLSYTKELRICFYWIRGDQSNRKYIKRNCTLFITSHTTPAGKWFIPAKKKM